MSNIIIIYIKHEIKIIYIFKMSETRLTIVFAVYITFLTHFPDH